MSFVLDASALLAAMRREKGYDTVAMRLSGAMISAVNLTEVGSRLSDLGEDLDAALKDIRRYGLQVVPFDFGLVTATVRLRSSTRHAGLSLGDRACLALAIREGATVLTADRAWAKLDVGCVIELIR